jgi:hypothetical protein
MSDLSHLEKLMTIHLPAVLAEGITAPGAVLARMAELDNQLLNSMCSDLVALEQFPNARSGQANRARAFTRLIVVRIWRELNEAP